MSDNDKHPDDDFGDEHQERPETSIHDDPAVYEVGYGKPPKKTQFQKGQSGNYNGRPKKPRTVEEKIEAAFQKEVYVHVEGKRIKISKLDLFIDQIINGALQKDPMYVRLAIPMANRMAIKTPFEVLPDDKAELDRLIANYSPMGKTDDNS